MLVGVSVFLLLVAVVAAGGFYVWMDQLLGQMAVDPQIEDIQDELDSTTSTSSPPEDGDEAPLPEGSTYLILGSDSRQGGGDAYGRSDTLIVVHLDPENDYASILSLPRDLRVEVPGYGKQKLNAAFAYGGPTLAIRTIQQSVGIDLDHFVHIDFDGFRKVTSALGGIYLDVDRRYYNSGGTYENIDLRPGYQALAGEEALDYVRFRHDANFDFGRIERQQRFLRAAREQAVRWENATRLPEVIGILTDYISTDDIATTEVLRTAYWAVRLDGDRIKQVSLDVSVQDIGGLSYVIASDGALSEARRSLVTPPGGGEAPAEDGETQETTTTSPSPDTTEPETSLDGVALDVLNGNGQTGVAGNAAAWFESRGAAVFDVDDAESFDVAETYVGYPAGSKSSATQVARFLGGTPIREQARRDRATVVLGADFEIPEGFDTTPVRERIPDGGTWASVADELPFPVYAPAELPEGYRYRDHRVYEIETRSGDQPALKVVYRFRSQDHYLGIMETEFLDAPAAAPGEEIEEDGVTYTLVRAGDGVERVWWEQDGTMYWITNTLFNLLSGEEMLSMARSMVRVH